MTAPTDNLPVRRRSDAEILRALKHYLIRREAGVLFNRACREADIQPDTVKRYRANHPDFAEAEQAAITAGVELAEEVLQGKAMGGDFPSLSKFLEANSEKYQKQTLTERQTIVVISADNALEKVQALKEELMRRKRDVPAGVVGKNPFIREPGERTPSPDDDVVDAEILD